MNRSDNEIKWTLQGCYVAHELRKLETHELKDAYQKLTKDYQWDEPQFKRYVWDIMNNPVIFNENYS